MNRALKCRFIGFILLIFVFAGEIIGQTFLIHGYIRNQASGEPLSYAYCTDTLSKKTVFSNEEGYFNMQCNGKTIIRFSFVGCIPKLVEISQLRDTLLTVWLIPDTMESVWVNAREKLFLQTMLGKVSVSSSQINRSPSFIGVPDGLKSLAQLPGITTGKEGFSYLYVRGGALGQNLILLDGIPLFYYNHAAGLVSAINTYAVENIELYKSGFPAQYGNCSSSVIDFRVREGNKQKFTAKAEIGTLSTQAFLEGPLSQSHKSSYLIAARATYFDILNIPKYLRYLDTTEYYKDMNSYDGVSFLSMNAFDINFKLTQELSTSSKVYMHVFTSQDFLTSIQNTGISNLKNGYRNSNVVVSSGLQSSLSSKIFLNVRIGYSNNYTRNFDYNEQKNDITEKTDNWVKSFSQYGLAKLSLDFFASNSMTLRTGIDLSRMTTHPFEEHSLYMSEGIIRKDTTKGELTEYLSQGYAFFVEAEKRIASIFSLQIGGRGTYFVSDNDHYFGIEPRFSARWMISPQRSFKLNYALTQQFYHQLLINAYGRYLSIWLPASSLRPPEQIHQIALGYAQIFKGFFAEAEVFYKEMKNLVEILPLEAMSSDFGLNKTLTRPGKGNAYGVEASLEKKWNRVSGHINYTLMWSWRKFDDINYGEWYPFTYNHRHTINISTMLTVTREWSLTALWQFMSGQPFTVPVGYAKGNSALDGYPVFERVNNFHLPPYHRLDVQAMREWTSKKNLRKYCKISVYNLYYRRNPAYAKVDGNGKLVIISLYGLIPTVSYGWNF
ncbi:MAG: TonB-dependent receptor [Bacteroidales bacterium]